MPIATLPENIILTRSSTWGRSSRSWLINVSKKELAD
jgi:hypothetical protein